MDPAAVAAAREKLAATCGGAASVRLARLAPARRVKVKGVFLVTPS
jgi:hypothetical protein